MLLQGCLWLHGKIWMRNWVEFYCFFNFFLNPHEVWLQIHPSITRSRLLFNLSAYEDLSYLPTTIYLGGKTGSGWSSRQVEPIPVKGSIGK